MWANYDQKDNWEPPMCPCTSPPFLSTLIHPADQPIVSRQTYTPTARYEETLTDKLFRLDSWSRPGIPFVDFVDIFMNCTCGLVMTRRATGKHHCSSLIDLTVESGFDADDEAENEPTGVIDLTLD
jgi:hypothetical protein